MENHKTASRVFLLLVLFILCSCPFDSGDEDGQMAYTISVHPGDRGYEALVKGGDIGGGWEADYPGVTAYYANHSVRPENVSVTPSGDSLTMKVCSDSRSDIQRLWMNLAVSGEADLATVPHSVNRQGENVFVIGPLGGKGCRTVILDFNLQGDAYNIRVFFLEILERFAYISDRRDPPARFLTDIYTMNMDNTGAFRFTESMEDTRHVFPAWSPGGEWIAFNRLEEVPCKGDTDSREQIYIAHPDGGSYRHVSEGMYYASEADWNPQGKLLTFDCKQNCGEYNDICIYNTRTDTATTFISGDSLYYNNNAYYGRWSPDGEHYVFATWGPYGGTKTRTWMHVPVNPRTGDTLAQPKEILRGNKFVEKSPGTYYRLFVDNWAWAPDSRHVAIEVYEYKYKNSWSGWRVNFEGVAIVDFEEIMNSSLPAVPDLLAKVPPPGESEGGRYMNPAFSSNGTRLYFDHFIGGDLADVEYIELDEYNTTSGINDLVADGNYNRHPAPFPVIHATFYPNGL